MAAEASLQLVENHLHSAFGFAASLAGKPVACSASGHRGRVGGSTIVLHFDLSSGLFAGHASLADPPSSSVLLPAVAWMEGTLLGSVAASAAIIGIAAVGGAMLTGRVRVRGGLSVILGCFILFGASRIAAGIRASREAAPSVASVPVPPPPVAASAAPSASPSPYDPHAGASVQPD